MSDIKEEQKRLYKRAEENDLMQIPNKIIENTILMKQTGDKLTNKIKELQNRINKALEILDKIQFFTTPIGQVVHLDMIISDIKKVKSILKGDNK